MTTGTTTTTPTRPRGELRLWLRRRTELGFALGVLAIAVFLTVGTITMDVPDGVGSPGPRFFPTLTAIFLYVVGVLLVIDVVRRPNLHAGTGSMQFSTDMLQDFAGLDDAEEIRRITSGRGVPHELVGDPMMSLTDLPAAADAPADRAAEVDPAAGGIEPTDAAEPTAAEPTDAAEEDVLGSGYVPVDWRTLGIVLAGLVLFTVLLTTLGWLICCAALFWVVSYALGSRRPLFDVAVAVIAASVIQLAFSAGLGLNLPSGILEGAVPWTS